MLNAKVRKDFDLRLDEIENALDSDDASLRVMAIIRFAVLFRELEPAIGALDFVLEENFEFGQRVMAIHDRIVKQS